MTGREAVFAGWEALQCVMNSWGIRSREGSSEWIHGRDFRNLDGDPIFPDSFAKDLRSSGDFERC